MADKEVIITYETLYDILRREKSKQELQPLEASFFQEVIDYMNEKKKILESQQKNKSIFSSSESSKTQKQLENIYKIIKELYERRENKILQQSLFSSRSESYEGMREMLPEEKKLFMEIKTTLNKYKQGILINLLNAQFPKIPETKEPKELKIDKKANPNKLIRFTSTIPKFIGTDLRIYGPYEEEDIANLSEDISNLLVNKKKAEEIKVKK